MARSGPQYYPGASRAYWYEDNYGGSAMEVNVSVLHTTEGTSLPSYGGGASAPNITAVPDFDAKKLRWYQHFRIDTSSRALVNLRGGAETNTLNVVQVELVGTCDPSTHRRWGGRQHIYWPEAPDWALRDLGRFIGWLHREHGLRLSAPTKWLPYPSSYGRTSARMSAAEWRGFYGICGHQHVVENDHGDPGAIDINRIIAYARGEATAPSKEDDMPTAEEIARAVLDCDDVEVPWESDNKKNQLGNALASMWRIVYRTEAKVEAQGAVLRELAAALAARDEAIDVDALVARIEAAIENVTVRLDVDNTPEGN